MPAKKSPASGPVFSCDRRDLADALKFVGKTVPNKPTIPVLACVHIDADADGTITLSTFDYETSHQARVVGLVGTPGRLLLPGLLTRDIVSAARGDHISVDAESGAAAKVTAGATTAQIPTVPVEDYPNLPAVPDPVGEVPADVLRALLDATLWACNPAAAILSNLSVLAGVRLYADHDTLHVEATDRHQLVLANVQWVGKADVDCVVPAGALTAAAAGLTGPVTVGADPTRLSLSTTARTVTSRLLDGDFPTVDRLVPTDDQIIATVTVDVDELVGALRRVGHAAERNTAVAFEPSGEDELHLSASGATPGAEVRDVVDAAVSDHAGLDAAGYAVGFHGPYLADAAASLDTRRVQIGLNRNRRHPCRIEAPADEAADQVVESVVVVMPRTLLGGTK